MYSFLPPSLQWIHFMKSTHQFAQRPLRGKYNFLERSISWVDLCTGPGGLDGVWVSLLNVLMWCVCGSRIHLKIQRKTVNTHPGIWWPYTEKIYLIWRCNLLTFFLNKKCHQLYWSLFERDSVVHISWEYSAAFIVWHISSTSTNVEAIRAVVLQSFSNLKRRLES